MEVHAHTHSPRQKWTHYLWEFMMLFLAVFAGFLAENQREHFVEHQREKQYINSMVIDLQSDTARLSELLTSTVGRENNYDSLRALLKSAGWSNQINRLYYYFLPTTYYDLFIPARRTIDQLENSGGLRLIKNAHVSDSITQYYQLVKETVSQGSTWLRYFDQYHEIAFRVFDYSQIDTTFYNREKILQRPAGYTLLTNDIVSVKVLYNKLFALRFILESYRQFLLESNRKAITTLNFLKKAYHLK